MGKESWTGWKMEFGRRLADRDGQVARATVRVGWRRRMVVRAFRVGGAAAGRSDTAALRGNESVGETPTGASGTLALPGHEPDTLKRAQQTGRRERVYVVD